LIIADSAPVNRACLGDGETSMAIKNTDERFGAVAQFVHWSIFLLFVVQFVIADWMIDAPKSPDKWALYDLHKSLGLTVLFIVFLRIGWRLSNPQPTPPTGLSGPQRLAARASHYILYGAMLLMPISAYVGSKAGVFAVSWFGIWEVPDLVNWIGAYEPQILGRNKWLHIFANDVHRILSYAIYGLVGLHLSAALWHHFVRKDDVLRRMLPARR
jgi:cytochrome b561